MSDKKRKPIKEGWLHIPDAEDKEAYLIGSRCTICGYTSFPKMSACPICKREGVMEQIPLSNRGKLDTFTVAQQAPAGFTAPYIQAYVLLPEGVKIFTLLKGVELRDDALQIGQDMEFVMDKIRDDENGNEIIGWKYRPAGSS